MRDRFSSLAFLAFAAATVTGCSLLVSTAGLSGGGDLDGGGSPQYGGPDGSPSGPGVVLGDASPLPIVSRGVDAASQGAPGGSSSGSLPGSSDASSLGPAPDDSGSADSSDSGPTACSLGLARVFLTSTKYDGDFGGVVGADSDCAASAAAQELGGEWRAWLSDSNNVASAHIYASPGGYVLLDGTVVATSYAALLSGSLSHAIDQTELGAPISDGFTEVWTGIDVTGALAGNGYCGDGAGDDWSSDDAAAPTPIVGHSNAADATWSAAYLQFCDRTNVRLYCFEVCP